MISAIILTKNEEKHIVDCIESVKWCDEVIVIDDNSTDRTIDVAKNNGAKVFTKNLENNFSAQRKFGLEKAGGEWVLFVDADERVSSALAKEIQQAVTTSKDGFYIQRKDVMWNKTLSYGETRNIFLLRLAKKNKGEWKGAVHETWNIKGSLDTLKNPLIHYPFDGYSEFLEKINLYTTIRAQELYKKGIKSGFWSIVLYTKGKFFYNYLVKVGILDGIAGLVHALTMSFHSFLVRSKLWLLWNKTK